MQREGAPLEVLTEARADSAPPVTVSPPPQDYISLFPLDDMQPSKLMRLLSSSEEDANILSSPGECAGPGRNSSRHSDLGGVLREAPHSHLWGRSERARQECVPFGLLRLLVPTHGDPRVAWVPPAGWKLCPVQAQGTGLSLLRPLLPTSRPVSPLPGHRCGLCR